MEHDVIIIDSLGHISNYQNNVSIASLLSTAQGRRQFAASMIAPIRRNLNYAGLARRALNVQQLPTPPVSAYYIQGINSAEVFDEPQVLTQEKLITAVDILKHGTDPFAHNTIVINSRGQIGEAGSFGIRGQRLTVPEFEIFSNPTVRISDVRQRRFNLIDRYERFEDDTVVIDSNGNIGQQDQLPYRFRYSKAVQKAKQEIMAQEDAEIFKALDQAVYNEKL